MKQHEDIDIGQVLSKYLESISPEQLIAELETPDRVELMTIPDQLLFCIPDDATNIQKVEICDIGQSFNLAGSLVFDSLEKLVWKSQYFTPRPANYISTVADAANQELALAA